MNAEERFLTNVVTDRPNRDCPRAFGSEIGRAAMTKGADPSTSGVSTAVQKRIPRSCPL
jgi:hypothetical protein